MHKTIGKHIYGTRKVSVNDPIGLAHIVGVASYSEALPRSKDIAQYTITHSKFSMCAIFLNYSAAEIYREN